MNEWIYGLIVGRILPSILAFFLQRQLNKISSSLDEKKRDEKNFNIIIIKSLLALGQNNKAMFEAIKTGRTNGNLDEAMVYYDKIKEELNNYMIDKASRD